MGWPRFENCEKCGKPILRTKTGHRGRAMTLELPEASVPWKKTAVIGSPQMKKGKRRRSIRFGKWRIAVDEYGHHRRLDKNELRKKGEAIHRRHRCRGREAHGPQDASTPA